jgi:integrase
MVVVCVVWKSVRLQDLDFDREQLSRIRKDEKDRYVPLSKHLIRGLKTYMKAKTYLFNGQPQGIAGGDFDSRYSQRGVQWAVKQASKAAGITGCVRFGTLCHFTRRRTRYYRKNLLGHENIETTMDYLHIAQLDTIKPLVHLIPCLPSGTK